jgi:hypothetical protein
VVVPLIPICKPFFHWFWEGKQKKKNEKEHKWEMRKLLL